MGQWGKEECHGFTITTPNPNRVPGRIALNLPIKDWWKRRSDVFLQLNWADIPTIYFEHIITLERKQREKLEQRCLFGGYIRNYGIVGRSCAYNIPEPIMNTDTRRKYSRFIMKVTTAQPERSLTWCLLLYDLYVLILPFSVCGM